MHKGKTWIFSVRITANSTHAQTGHSPNAIATLECSILGLARVRKNCQIPKATSLIERSDWTYSNLKSTFYWTSIKRNTECTCTFEVQVVWSAHSAVENSFVLLQKNTAKDFFVLPPTDTSETSGISLTPDTFRAKPKVVRRNLTAEPRGVASNWYFKGPHCKSNTVILIPVFCDSPRLCKSSLISLSQNSSVG
jgi:hypothetical protein